MFPPWEQRLNGGEFPPSLMACTRQHDAAMADALISENSTQSANNFPSALDGVATAIRFICQVFLNDADSNSTYMELLSASKDGREQIRSKIIASGTVGTPIVHKYFTECITKTMSRKVVEQALACLDDDGMVKRIVMEEINASNAHVAAKVEAKRAADELARINHNVYGRLPQRIGC
jgi:hypothetical protein